MLTPESVRRADYLRYRDEFILYTDPLPDSLEGINAEIGRLALERQKNLPKSDEWQLISARLEDLKHLESTMIKQTASPTVYIQSGAGSRLSVGSVDNSINYVTITEANVFPKLRSEIEAQLPDSSEKQEVLASLNELEEAKGSSSYGA
jgi:hypothetical protein